MDKKLTTGDNGLANQLNYNFYYPAGGGSLNSSEEIFDYWKRTDYSYAISCREIPEFRAALTKQTNGEYELNLFFNNDSFPKGFALNEGKKLTRSTKERIINTIQGFLRITEEDYLKRTNN